MCIRDRKDVVEEEEEEEEEARYTISKQSEEESTGGKTETKTETHVVVWLTRGESNTRRAIADERRVFTDATRRATTAA